MTSDQIKVLKETYMTESVKPNGNPGTEGEYMRFALDGGIDFVTSKDFVVFDDANEMLHCVCINDHAISQADFPVKVISSEYAIVQQVETIMSIENFEKFLNSGFMADAANDKQKEFMLKWAKNNIRNQALQPMDSEPAYEDNTKVIPMPATKIEREDYVASTAYAKDGNGNRVFFKTINDAFNTLEDGSTLYITSDTALTEPVELSDDKEITVDLAGHKIRSAIGENKKLFNVTNGTLNLINSSTTDGVIENTGHAIYISSVESGAEPVVNIEDGVTVSSTDGYAVFVKGAGTLNSKGNLKNTNANYATVTGNGLYGGGTVNIIGGSVANTKEAAIYFPQEGKLKIDQATIEGYCGIYAKAGDITITNSEIIGNGEPQEYKSAGDGWVPTGDAIVIDCCGYPGGTPKLYISNLKLNSKARYIGVYDKDGNESPDAFKDNVKIGEGVVVDNISYAKYCDEGIKLAYYETVFGTDYFITKEATPGFEMTKSDGTTVEVNTLTEAFENAEDGDTITVVDDEIITDTVKFDKGASVTIDLNGNNIYTEAATAINIVGSTVNLTGSGRLECDKIGFRVDGKASESALKIGEDIEIVSSGMPAVFATGKATVEVSGTLDTKSVYAAIQGNGKADAAGTKIIINDGAMISSDSGLAIYHPQDGELEINGGTFVGYSALYMKAGKLTISGNPIFRATGEKVDYEFSNNGAQPTGDAVILDFCDYPGGKPSATITGGTFKSDHATAFECYTKDGTTNPEGAKENVNISGGDFTSAPNTDYIADGYKAYHDNRTDLYTVVKV